MAAPAAEEEAPASPPSRDTTGTGPAPDLPPPPRPAPAKPQAEDPPETPEAPAPGDASKSPQPMDGGDATAPATNPAPASTTDPAAAPGSGDAAMQEPAAPGDSSPPVTPPVTPGAGSSSNNVIAPRPPAPDDQSAPPDPSTAAPTYYALVASEAYLAGELKALGPQYMSIGPEIYVPVGDTRFKVRAPSGLTLSETLFLRVESTWIDPVTPPEGSRIKAPEDGKMVLTELYGEVKVRNKDYLPLGPSYKLATEGMVVTTGTEISTGDSSSVAVVMHGLQSTRIGPSSNAILRQSTDNGAVSTDLNLIDGTVFVRVGGRDDASTFRVRTPVGIAEARGSEFAVWYRKERIVVCSAKGRVALTDLGGRELVTLEKYEPGVVNVAGIPALDIRQKAEWLHRMLMVIKKLNTKSTALLDERDKGVALSDREQKWLKSLHPITYFIKAKLVKVGSK